jgi:transposase-like protein
MEEVKKPRRIFTPQQKFEMLKEIGRCPTIREGLEKYQLEYSVYRRWKRQLEVGVNASLRNGRPLKPMDVRRLEQENRKLKEALLNQSLLMAELKKEMGLDSPIEEGSALRSFSGRSWLNSSNLNARPGAR